MKLVRNEYLPNGIFGELYTDDKTLHLCTLEHAYVLDQDDDRPEISYAPKIPHGIYKCVKGLHQLAKEGGELHPIETYEVTGVVGHTGILIHPGNFNEDSNGCILLGTRIDPTDKMLMHSKDAFNAFMRYVAKYTEFWLEVTCKTSL